MNVGCEIVSMPGMSRAISVHREPDGRRLANSGGFKEARFGEVPANSPVNCRRKPNIWQKMFLIAMEFSKKAKFRLVMLEKKIQRPACIGASSHPPAGKLASKSVKVGGM